MTYCTTTQLAHVMSAKHNNNLCQTKNTTFILGELHLCAVPSRLLINESPDQAGALHPNENVNYF